MKRYQLTGSDGEEAFAEEDSLYGGWVVYEDAQEEIERLRNKLTNAVTRMDRARHIRTDGKPTPANNWGMLDTSDLVEME